MSLHRLARPSLDIVPVFLAPSAFLPCPRGQQVSAFSTTAAHYARHTKKDRNRNRGVSALRRTGPKQPLSVSKEELPKPVLDPAKRSKVPVKDDHGLWQFFTKDKKPLVLAEVTSGHGRAWSVEELRAKSFDDLHSLWWVCVKERNRILTQEKHRKRVNAGFGEFESSEREREVRKTQKAIKHALTERYYAWDEARRIARDQGILTENNEELYEEEPEAVTTSEAEPEALLPDSMPREESLKEQPRAP